QLVDEAFIAGRGFDPESAFVFGEEARLVMAKHPRRRQGQHQRRVAGDGVGENGDSVIGHGNARVSMFTSVEMQTAFSVCLRKVRFIGTESIRSRARVAFL